MSVQVSWFNYNSVWFPSQDNWYHLQ